MGTPADHLPKPVNEKSISILCKSLNLPRPTSVHHANVPAEYHSIYFLTFRADDWASLPPKLTEPTTATTTHWEPVQRPVMVLRVAGDHLPGFKTMNEVAVISWLLRYMPGIPVPRVLMYDSTCDNPLGHEYMLLEYVRGERLDYVYPRLSEERRRDIVDQLIGFLLELHGRPMYHIGGLTFGPSGRAGWGNDLYHCREILPGRVVEETFWHVPDIARYWTPPSEHLEESVPPQTVDTLNISGPFFSYIAYICAHLNKYIHAIEIHKSLTFMRPYLPRIRNLISLLKQPENTAELNDVKIRLAHKDLHFANMLYDDTTGRITAILDWEFAGAVPFTRWNPSRAFLWPGTAYGQNAAEEKKWLWDVFRKRCEDLGATDLLEDEAYSGVKQAAMQKAANFLRAIVEVSPRGEKEELARGDWLYNFTEQLDVLGV